MAMEYVILAVVWWTFAVVVFMSVEDQPDVSISHALALAAFWPVFAPMGLAVILWRIPFRSARTIRADLRNRRLLKKFERWLDEQETEGGK